MTDTIPRRRLGRTERQVSALGLGGHTYDVGPDGFCTHDQRAELLAGLVRDGVNYLDTTWMHEVELLADSLRRADLLGRLHRGELHVSLQHVDGMSDPAWRDKLRGELETRLEVLDLPSAGLFLMGTGNHTPGAKTMTACIEAMARLREEGLIQHVGVSCHAFDDFGPLADAIEATGQVDYLMLRYNYKYRQIEERLLPVAAAQDIGVVAMLVFCWDCGPGQWGRRISVFEPTDGQPMPDANDGRLTPAQENIRWVLQQPQIATTVPAINAPWEASQNVAAARALDTPADTSAFTPFLDRMWSRSQLADLAKSAKSEPIRARAAALLAETSLNA